jgi:phospholipid transport system substrate-binding protein
MKKILLSFHLFIFLVCPFTVFAGQPLATVEKHVNEALAVLRDPALKAESAKKTRKEKIRAISERMFDFIELSRRTLGSNWKKFNPDQQQEFIKLYKDILEGAYMDKIMSYTNEKISFQKEISLSENKAEIQSFITSKNRETPVFYRVILKGNDWKVYDVVIEGVSLVKNYRTQFREILSNKSPEELLKSLRERGKKKK